MAEEYDLAILGGGPAGLTAAIYAARYGMKTILISKDVGGAANYAHKIENYPGYSGSGMELMQKFFKQAKEVGAEFLSDDLIDLKKEKHFEVITGRKQKITARTIILALGTQKRKLNVKGEDKFLGKGVSYCATCDGFFFKNKDVAVIGGGEAGCKAAVLLSSIAKKVYLIFRGEKEKCVEMESRMIRKRENIEILDLTEAIEIKGRAQVQELVARKNGKRKKLKVDGVFIEVGSLPVSDVCKILGIKIDENGYILVDEHLNTNVKGIFAAGDVVKSRLKQIIVAASQGAVAAKSAYDFLREK